MDTARAQGIMKNPEGPPEHAQFGAELEKRHAHATQQAEHHRRQLRQWELVRSGCQAGLAAMEEMQVNEAVSEAPKSEVEPEHGGGAW